MAVIELDDDYDKRTLVGLYCRHFLENCRPFTFFELKPLVVDIFPKNYMEITKKMTIKRNVVIHFSNHDHDHHQTLDNIYDGIGNCHL